MDDPWIQHLINPQAMDGLYEDEPPLHQFELEEIRLERRGPSFFMCGALCQFPDHPRSGWEDDSDGLQIRFSLSAVDHFKGHGATGGVVDLTIAQASDGFGVAVKGRGDDMEFEVSGIGLQVIGMKPYSRE